MRKRIQILALCVAVSLFLSILSGCGIIVIRPRNPAETSQETTPATLPPVTSSDDPILPGSDRDTKIDYEPIAQNYLKSVSPKKYDNANFIIASTDVSYLKPGSEAESSSISNALYKRNQAVEEEFGVRLLITKNEPADLTEKLQQSLESGRVFADLILTETSSVAALAQEALLTNLRSLMYVDFSRPYYFQSSLEAFTYGYQSWAVSGQASLSPDSLACLLFNRAMFEISDTPLPYSFVQDGTWTWEEYYNGYIALRGYNTYDAAFDGTDWPSNLVCSAGGKIIESRLGDKPRTALNYSQSPLFEKLSYLTKYGTPFDEDDAHKAFFDEGRILYFFTNLGTLKGQELASTRWGLLPLPKLSETDPTYSSLANKNASVFAVPAVITDNAMTGRILSALNAASYGVIISADANYRQQETLFRDIDSADMYMKILFSTSFDYSRALGASIEGLQDTIEAELSPAILQASYWATYDSIANKITQILEKASY